MVTRDDIVRSTSATLLKKTAHVRFNAISIDSRSIKKGDVFFAIKGPRFDGHDFVGQAVKAGATAVVVSKPIKDLSASGKTIKASIFLVKDTGLALGKLAQWLRRKHAIPFIAITGSSGKTTTKEMVAAVLSGNHRVLKNIGTFNNHIGVPLTIFQLKKSHTVGVVEIGTNHFGEIASLSQIVMPEVAVITNIGSSHLEFLKDTHGVLQEKTSIIRHLEKPKILLLNRDDALLRAMRLPQAVKVFSFGINEKSDFSASHITSRNNRLEFVFNHRHVFSLKTFGLFNIYNALASIGCGLLFGVGIDAIRRRLENFEFPKQRLRSIDCAGFNIIDDSYNSNPSSLRQAVESMSCYQAQGRRIVVMGDMLELGKQALQLHREVGAFIARSPIDMLVTFGELSKASAEAAKEKSSKHAAIRSFDSKEELISFLKDNLQTNDTVLIKGSRLLKMEDITVSLQSHVI